MHGSSLLTLCRPDDLGQMHMNKTPSPERSYKHTKSPWTADRQKKKTKTSPAWKGLPDVIESEEAEDLASLRSSAFPLHFCSFQGTLVPCRLSHDLHTLITCLQVVMPLNSQDLLVRRKTKHGQDTFQMALQALGEAPLPPGLSSQIPTSLWLGYTASTTFLHPGPTFSRCA